MPERVVATCRCCCSMLRLYECMYMCICIHVCVYSCIQCGAVTRSIGHMHVSYSLVPHLHVYVNCDTWHQGNLAMVLIAAQADRTSNHNKPYISKKCLCRQTPHWEYPYSGGDTKHGMNHTRPFHNQFAQASDRNSEGLCF